MAYNPQRKDQNTSLRSSERQVANDINKIDKNHRLRYNQALEYITQNDIVLDLGIGVGYGANTLSKKAKFVYGIDDSEEAIEYALQNWNNQNIKYIHGNVINIDSLIKHDIDVITAFELIEHVKDYKILISKIKNLAKKYIVISVPHDSVPLTKSSWHWIHFSKEVLLKLFVDSNWENIYYDEPIYGKGRACYAIFKRK